jgi:hypothetical protein
VGAALLGELVGAADGNGVVGEEVGSADGEAVGAMVIVAITSQFGAPFGVVTICPFRTFEPHTVGTEVSPGHAYPASHTLHVVVLTRSAYMPGAHAMQWIVPSYSAKRPTGQGIAPVVVPPRL